MENAHGQNQLAKKTFLFAVGEKGFGEVVWQETLTLAYWKIVHPSADLMFFLSALPVSFQFSGGTQVLLLEPPQVPFPLSFPPSSTALSLNSHSQAGRGRLEVLLGYSSHSYESSGLSCLLRGCTRGTHTSAQPEVMLGVCWHGSIISQYSECSAPQWTLLGPCICSCSGLLGPFSSSGSVHAYVCVCADPCQHCWSLLLGSRIFVWL